MENLHELLWKFQYYQRYTWKYRTKIRSDSMRLDETIELGSPNWIIQSTKIYF